MNTTLLTGPVAQALGWALLHLLWQASLVAAILAGVLALMSRRSANARYAASCTALAVVFAMFVGTAVRSYDPAVAPIAAAPAGAADEVSTIPLTQIPMVIAEGAASGLRDRALETLATARNAFPTIVGIWLLGVVILSTRLLASWITARRLVRGASQPPHRDWQRLTARLGEALGLRRAVTLLQSAAVEVPSVVGWLRPVILVPASALSGMTAEQIEMVLAHELAHIRRHDFFVNLLQAIAETLMFYHPAVWWMSRRVRVERENCCDDLAVAVCGSAVQYARALSRLEELRASAPMSVVVAANGGSLLARIRRIATGREEGTASASRWAAAVTMLVILAVAAIAPSVPALAQREEEPETPAAATVDVVAPETPVTPEPPEAAAPAVAMGLDLEAISEAAAEAVETPEIDVDVDMPDIDFDFDHDFAYDLDFDEMTPLPPGVPLVAGVPAPPAAPAVPGVTPMPALAPRAAVAPGAPRPAIAPAPPTPPARRHGDDEEQERDISDGGKLSVDELIALRAAGVTPAYINSMRQLFQPLSVRSVSGLAAMGVTPEYVNEMRAAGFEVKRAREATSLKAVGVTPEYVARMKAAGLSPLGVREITGLAANGVDPAFLNDMRAAGFAVTSAREATSLKAIGVTPEYVREMRAAGFELKSAQDAVRLRAVDVDGEYVRQMRAAGFEMKSADDAASMKAVGVTPQWVQSMSAAGVKITSGRQASRLRASGVTPEFVRRLAAAGYTNLSTDELANLAAAGIDEDFIREMQQYRKKN